MQDKFIVNKIDELKFEVAKSQSLDSVQKMLIEDLLKRCAEAASSQECNNLAIDTDNYARREDKQHAAARHNRQW